MNKKLSRQIRKYLREQKQKKRRKNILLFLGAAVVLSVSYALMLPALTMETDTYCGYEEHIAHTEEDGCYAWVRTLNCSLSDGTDAENNQKDGSDAVSVSGSGDYTSSDTHQHTAACYTEVKQLVCQKELHQHTAQCYEDPVSSLAEEFMLTAQTEDGRRISLTGPNSSLPYPADELTLTAEAIVNDQAKDLVNIAAENAGQKNGSIDLFDICLWHNDEEVQPTGLVRLTFETANVPDDTGTAGVFHVDAIHNQTTDMNAQLTENGSVIVDTDHFSVYGVVIAAGGNVVINHQVIPVWNETSEQLTSLTFKASSGTDKMIYRVEYSDDNGSSWTALTESGKTDKNTSVTLDASGTLSDVTLNRLYRVYGYKDNKNYGYTETLTLCDILDMEKAGFSQWLENSYVQDFGGAALPTTVSELYNAFSLYQSLPELTLDTRMEGDTMYAEVTTDGTGTYRYVWEYQDDNGEWQLLTSESGSSVNVSELDVLLNGGYPVHCKIYENDALKAVSNTVFVNPLREVYDEAIEAINSGLNLGTLAINGQTFTDYFYYGNVAKDSRVPFNDASGYADYLAKVYLDAGGGDAGLAAAEEKWNYYLYDLYDPNDKSNTTDYPAYTYGDTDLEWPKDGTSSFHGALAPQVDQLNYDFLENGVDYSNFVSNLKKTVTAAAPGDENTERKYHVDLLADAQAKAVGPVAMVLQVQTSLQMFDLKHANALVGEGRTAKGAAAKNNEIATLYDIKHALLRFVDYMEEHYPGNNLVLGITEVKHGGSTSMLVGRDDYGNTLYVTNNYDILRRSLLDWDSFGNCEHVHYDANMLKNVTSTIEDNLQGWKDFYGVEIKYKDIQKVAVILGGSTENTEKEDGYGCPLPWSTFQSAKLNSVYGIRTNEGVPVASNAQQVISWLDYSENNKGDTFVDGTGTTYTEKYVATTEDAVYQYLVDIAESEMRKKGIEITATDKYVDDVTVTDTVTDEFHLDADEPIVATIYNKDGTVLEQKVISLDDPDLTITENEDGTTTVSYNFGRVYNTKKCKLHFGIQANEAYIGSNNVFSNEGRAGVSYSHRKIDGDGNPTGETEYYQVNSRNTPQVNVPIRFDTTDGDTVNLILGESADLADLSPAIVENAEDLIDNYDQINGTLSYKWVLPDGTEVDAGSVTVKDGSIGEQNFPSRTYDFIGTEAGQYQCTLKVTFTPEPVDSASKNFSDDNTKTAVNALTKDGKVWINVVDGDVDARFYVRKEWVGDPPEGTDAITFRILANGEPVTDESGKDILYTLSADQNWETEISGLPSVADGVILSYSVEEIPVPEGYTVSYDSTTRSEDAYRAKMTLSFKTKKDLGDKALRITYSYNGQTYTYDIEKGDFKKDIQYVYVINNLPLDENGNVYDCQLIRVNELKDGSKDNSVELTSSNASAEKYISGTRSVEVKLIQNAPGYELPQTGGPGTKWFTWGGILLMLGALMYGYSLFRGRERGIRKS